MSFYAEHARLTKELRKKRSTLEERKLERVNLERVAIPDDYHCSCEHCSQFLGVLMRADGTFYNKLDRNSYYARDEKAHVAKTPVHLARWCVQEFTRPGDWVLDPTIGAGTTAVEAVNAGRHVIGVELQFGDLTRKNVEAQVPVVSYAIRDGDARDLESLIPESGFRLVVNNPPYSGDETQVGFRIFQLKKYDHSLTQNLAFSREDSRYFADMRDIYAACARKLVEGGRLCVGVKDMCRGRSPFLLHSMLADTISSIDDLRFVGTALLPHYPPTLFMSTYVKRCPEVPLPRYQTIIIFEKTRRT